MPGGMQILGKCTTVFIFVDAGSATYQFYLTKFVNAYKRSV